MLLTQKAHTSNDICALVCLPVNDFVNYGLLFRCGFSQIDSGGFNAFMPHEVSEESDVVEAFQETFCKTMPE